MSPLPPSADPDSNEYYGDYSNANDTHMASDNDPSADPAASSTDPRQPNDPNLSSKLKRTACVLCRKRKLRCDAARPACGTCARLGHECEYDEQRKKSGPKRGYVKALETRLG